MTIAVPNPPGLPLPYDYWILIANLGMSVFVPAPDSAVIPADSGAPSEPLISQVEDTSGPVRAARVYEYKSAARVEGATTLLDEPAVAQRGSRMRRASTREVDLAIILVTDERDNDAEHGLADVRVDRAWDEGLLAVVSRPV